MHKILFWSGGKDSFLARHFLKMPVEKLILCTTFNEEESIVPHQEIHLNYIHKQAVFLKHTLITVPLPHPCTNDIYLERVFGALGSMPFEIESLVFGDWHLQEIREWRESVFTERGFKCEFPIWKKPLEELLDTLDSLNQKIVLNNVAQEYQNKISVGDEYNREFVSNLPDDIDPMGENGEFHTMVVV